jgi:hypothetical protein
MRLELHIYLHGDDSVSTALAAIQRDITAVLNKEATIMTGILDVQAEVEGLKQDVASLKSVVAVAVTDLDALAALAKQAQTDPAALAQVLTDIQGVRADLAGATGSLTDAETRDAPAA